MTTLTKELIEQRLRGTAGDQLVITPILSNKQIGRASIDVRLANQFIVFRMHRLGAFDPYSSDRSALHQIQERQVVRYGGSFVLHPGMLALGATLEYVAMPGDIECQVEGRSSWARVGLQIATATAVEPGFQGAITLELSNVGTSPLYLRPGQRVAQLIFRDASPKIVAPYTGDMRKYRLPVGPEFSRLDEDIDGRAFLK